MIILASNNEKKIKELKNILNRKDVFSLKDIDFKIDIEEFGVTFEQNALIKAQAIADIYPNDTIIADDSGLLIETLNNTPGVYSARYAFDPDNKISQDQLNIDKVIKNMKNKDNRNASFKTVICLIHNNEIPIFFEGKVDGVILKKQSGSNGFGYDPIFSIDGIKSFASLNESQKDKISHRGKSLNKLKQKLGELCIL